MYIQIAIIYFKILDKALLHLQKILSKDKEEFNIGYLYNKISFEMFLLL